SPDPVADRDAPLAGRTALVTGAARGIGASVASVLARAGAQVVVLHVPQAQDDLVRTPHRLGATALPFDITAPYAAARISSSTPGRPGASARLTTRCWPATGRRSSCWTSRRPRTTSYAPPTGSGPPCCGWTSSLPMPRPASPLPHRTGSTSAYTTRASAATAA